MAEWYICRQQITHMSDICMISVIILEMLFYIIIVRRLDMKTLECNIKIQNWESTGVKYQYQ